MENSRKAPVNPLFHTFVGNVWNCESKASVKFRKLKFRKLKFRKLKFRKLKLCSLKS